MILHDATHLLTSAKRLVGAVTVADFCATLDEIRLQVSDLTADLATSQPHHVSGATRAAARRTGR